MSTPRPQRQQVPQDLPTIWHRISVGASMVALAMAAGCSILPKADPVDVYRLPSSPAMSVTNTATAAPPAGWSLRITRPRSGQTLDSTHIVVLPQDNLMRNYQGARWSDPAPVLVRDRLLQAFAANGRTAQVSSDDNNVQSSLELSSDLLAYQTEYQDGVPVVVVILEARLLRSDVRNTVAAQRFTIRVAVDGKEVPQVVRAFGTASDRLAAEVVT